MKRCNNCYKSSCNCGNSYVKSMAMPTFTEDLYKFATENGLFEGTVEEFLEYMKGPQGMSVYEWAVANGFTSLSPEEWYQEIAGTLQYTTDNWN